MDNLPFELIFSIAIHLDSPQDLCSFSRVSSLFLSVARDDRLWKRLCYRLYNIKSPLSQMIKSYHDLFTKILAPYGRYLGYWKSNEKYLGGLINVHLNISDGTIVAEKIKIINSSTNATHFFFDEDDHNENDEEEDFLLNPVYILNKLFTIDSISHQIFCHKCNMPHDDLTWINKFTSNGKYFGLSQEVLPINERSSLVSHDHSFTDGPDERDIYFTQHCSDSLPIVYHPLSFPIPTTGVNDHPLSRLNGLWVGSYGSHGLELLHLEFCHQFICPVTVDDDPREIVVPNALIARKISGDPNVPHSQISFAAVRPIEVQSDSPQCYEGIGQIADTDYFQPQFIRTKVIPVSDNALKVVWYDLHDTSLYKRCQF